MYTVRSTVHVPSDTLRTWSMVPHPRGEMLSSMNSSNKPRSQNERKPKNPRFDLCFTIVFHNFTKSLILSDGRYAHYGIRVRPKIMKKCLFAKKGISLKNSSLKSKA